VPKKVEQINDYLFIDVGTQNNLTPNRKKSTEIKSVDTRRKHQVGASPPISGISRVTSLKS